MRENLRDAFDFIETYAQKQKLKIDILTQLK